MQFVFSELVLLARSDTSPRKFEEMSSKSMWATSKCCIFTYVPSVISTEFALPTMFSSRWVADFYIILEPPTNITETWPFAPSNLNMASLWRWGRRAGCTSCRRIIGSGSHVQGKIVWTRRISAFVVSIFGAPKCNFVVFASNWPSYLIPAVRATSK